MLLVWLGKRGLNIYNGLPIHLKIWSILAMGNAGSPCNMSASCYWLPSAFYETMHVGPTGCLTGNRGIATCLTDLLGILAHAGETESDEGTLLVKARNQLMFFPSSALRARAVVVVPLPSEPLTLDPRWSERSESVHVS